MFVAVFIIHAQEPWGRKEKAVIYLMMYVVLYISGSGKYSVDKK
jgi:putative oxidoreductase